MSSAGTSKRHVAVWIDHLQAEIFHIEPELFEVSSIGTPTHALAREANKQGRQGSEDFFHLVADTLRDADEILIVGPSSAKLDLFRRLHRRDPRIAEKVLGVETCEHPSDRQLVAHVRHYFHTRGGIVPRA